MDHVRLMALPASEGGKRDLDTKMLQEIAQDNLVRTAASNQPMFSMDIDYDAILFQKAQALDDWKKLDAATRSQFSNLGAFEAGRGIPDLKDLALGSGPVKVLASTR